MTSQGSESPSPDRRVRGGLRTLIDEMMAQLRAAARQDVWTPEERERAEADLARIMERVRGRALGGPDDEPHA